MRILHLFLSLILLTTTCFGQNLKTIRGMPFVNRAHRLAPTAGWLFNEGSGGQVFDLSGNGNTGTLQGTAPSWTSGKFGSAVLLPGTDETIQFGHVIDIGAMTIVWWMKTPHDWSARKGVIDVKSSYEGVTLEPDSGVIRLRLASDNTVLFSGCPADLSIYRQFAVVITGSGQNDIDNAMIYVDATPLTIGGASKTGTPDAWTEFEFGKNSYGALNCTIDNVSLYNCILTASEIALLYREPFLFERADVVLMAVEAPTGVPVPVFYYHYVNHALLVLPFIPFGLYCYVRSRKCAA